MMMSCGQKEDDAQISRNSCHQLTESQDNIKNDCLPLHFGCFESAVDYQYGVYVTIPSSALKQSCSVLRTAYCIDKCF